MRLDRLVEASLGGSGLVVSSSGEVGIEVTSVTMDSRAVIPGALFACVPGRTSDGHAFAAAAVAAGAVALLCERPLDLRVPQVVVSSARRAVGPVAAALHGWPSEALTVVGVTGTNGKTTTCALLAAVLEAHGWPTATVGTLTQERTTPEAPELQARLAELRLEGRRAVAMEVSSHALDQHRAGGVRFAAGVLTNVTQDHLDYHGTMERYFEAKAMLFSDGRSAIAVLNRDDPWASRLVERLSGGPVPVHTFGMSDAGELEISPSGSRFVLDGVRVRMALGGRFNVANGLAAACCARALGATAEEVAAGLAAVDRVPGRFEAVHAGQAFTVLVDYAHTPDGLRQALQAARELATQRLLVVFGAGGDRDHDKRPRMGEVATQLADLVVVTSDNPRSEDPGAIIEQVVAGASGPGRVSIVADRGAAIRTAVWVAGPGDVVVIAGKGHEQGQEIAGRRLPFDDASAARQAIAELLRRPGSGAGAPA